MKTCPCNEHPLTPHCYMGKLGKQRGGSDVYPRSMFWAKIRKNITFIHLKIAIFTAVKYCSILHGHVCVMYPILQSTTGVCRFLIASLKHSLRAVLKTAPKKENTTLLDTIRAVQPQQIARGLRCQISEVEKLYYSVTARLISAFFFRYLDSTIPLLPKYKISRL